MQQRPQSQQQAFQPISVNEMAGEFVDASNRDTDSQRRRFMAEMLGQPQPQTEPQPAGWGKWIGFTIIILMMFGGTLGIGAGTGFVKFGASGGGAYTSPLPTQALGLPGATLGGAVQASVDLGEWRMKIDSTTKTVRLGSLSTAEDRAYAAQCELNGWAVIPWTGVAVSGAVGIRAGATPGVAAGSILQILAKWRLDNPGQVWRRLDDKERAELLAMIDTLNRVGGGP